MSALYLDIYCHIARVDIDAYRCMLAVPEFAREACLRLCTRMVPPNTGNTVCAYKPFFYKYTQIFTKINKYQQ
jgi:hypothetical protein